MAKTRNAFRCGILDFVVVLLCIVELFQYFVEWF